MSAFLWTWISRKQWKGKVFYGETSGSWICFLTGDRSKIPDLLETISKIFLQPQMFSWTKNKPLRPQKTFSKLYKKIPDQNFCLNVYRIVLLPPRAFKTSVLKIFEKSLNFFKSLWSITHPKNSLRLQPQIKHLWEN